MNNDEPNEPELTRREAQVALGVADGRTCIEMGRHLRLSHESVRSLMKRLRKKTGLHRKPQMAVWADNKRAWLTARLEYFKAKKKTPRRPARAAKKVAV